MAYEVTKRYVVQSGGIASGEGPIGAPWTLQHAVDTATTATTNKNEDVWIKLGGSDYTKENSSYTVLGDGNRADNLRLRLIGYNTNIGDMNPINPFTGLPGAFYQSALDAHINGVDATKKVKITGFGTDHTILDLGGALNIDIQNFDFSSAAAGVATGSAATGSITNCAFSAGTIGIDTTGSSFLRIMGNFFGTTSGCQGAVSAANVYAHNVYAVSTLGIAYPFKESSIFGNIFVGGTRGVFNSLRCNVFNNLFYNQTDAAIETRSDAADSVLNEWNNIFYVPALADFAVQLIDTQGSVALSNWSLAFTPAGVWSETGAASPNNYAWYGVPNDENLRGPNSLINVDPLMIDPANKIYTLAPNSPCWNAGKPDVFGVRSHIGPLTRNIPLRADARGRSRL